MHMKTEFSDRLGRPIYVGDVIQYRLGLNSKHGGPKSYRIIKTKRAVKLADVRLAEPKDGLLLRKTYERHIVITDTSRRIKD